MNVCGVFCEGSYRSGLSRDLSVWMEGGWVVLGHVPVFAGGFFCSFSRNSAAVVQVAAVVVVVVVVVVAAAAAAAAAALVVVAAGQGDRRLIVFYCVFRSSFSSVSVDPAVVPAP